MTDVFDAYAHAIAAMALAGLLGLVLGPVVGGKKAARGLPPGADPVADYADPVYRWHRAYLNLSESLPAFAAVTIAAILAGAAPFWVNLLASFFLIARLVMLTVHVRGMGGADMSLRSFAYGAGWLACIGLALLAIAGVMSGG